MEGEKIKCPNCGSEQITADKKGFSGGKAVAGGLVAGPIGILAGTIGKNKVFVTCLNCGIKWQAGAHKQIEEKRIKQDEVIENFRARKLLVESYDKGDMKEAREHYKTINNKEGSEDEIAKEVEYYRNSGKISNGCLVAIVVSVFLIIFGYFLLKK